jgi:putative ABC transport system permease protein
MQRARVHLAWLNLTHDKRRLLVATAGIAFAVFLMFTEYGFWNGLLDSMVALIDELDADLIIVNASKYSLTITEPFSRRRLEQARSVPGVRGAYPLYIQFQSAFWKNPDRPRDPQDEAAIRPIRVLAFNPEDPVFLSPKIKQFAGQLEQPDTVLLDIQSRPFYGRRERDVVRELSQHSVRILGTFRLGTDFSTDGNLVTSDRTYARFFPSRAGPEATLGEVEVGVVQVAPGTDRKQIRRAVRAALPDDVQVLTRDEFRQQEQTFWQRSTPVGYIFGLGMAVGFAVGVVICYQILSADVADHLAEYATLKAMGYRDGYLTRLVLSEAVLLSLFGYVPGLLLSWLLYRWLAWQTGLPMRLWLMQRLALILALTVSMCFLSGLIAIRKVKVADPAEVF